jgi:hypothetical protein
MFGITQGMAKLSLYSRYLSSIQRLLKSYFAPLLTLSGALDNK